jgi:uncharacterized membrane protein
MHQDEVNDREWRDQANWTGAVLRRYASARDTRLWVPKSNPALGWTLNFAHPASLYWAAGLILALPIAIILVAVWLARRIHG